MARDHHASRGLRDEASVGPDPRRARELRRLSELKFRVADGEPDIVGWTVFASTGRELGRVSDLLVDEEAREVVMLDIDLRRGDQHSLAPLRAAWIDHAAKRVVLDARELEQHSDELLPGLPRSGALSDDDVSRFNDGYVRAYGDRGVDRDAEWHVRRGDEELHFGVAPRADLDATPRRDDRTLGAAAAGGAGAAMLGSGRDDLRDNRLRDERLDERGGGPHFDESRRIDRIMEGQPAPRPADRLDDRTEPRRLLDRDALPPAERPVLAADDPGIGRDERRLLGDDASTLHPSGAIDPRELDGRVRIDEGATVDDAAPVGGVRYDAPADAPSRGYGRPDERYGEEYGSGRIGFDRVVSRHPRSADLDPSDVPLDRRPVDAADAARRLDDAGDRTIERRVDDQPVVRYRRYDDLPPSDLRR